MHMVHASNPSTLKVEAEGSGGKKMKINHTIKCRFGMIILPTFRQNLPRYAQDLSILYVEVRKQFSGDTSLLPESTPMPVLNSEQPHQAPKAVPCY